MLWLVARLDREKSTKKVAFWALQRFSGDNFHLVKKPWDLSKRRQIHVSQLISGQILSNKKWGFLEFEQSIPYANLNLPEVTAIREAKIMMWWYPEKKTNASLGKRLGW